MSHEPSHESAEQNRDIADRNIARLLGEAYRPEEPDEEFVATVRKELEAAALRRRESADEQPLDLPAWPESWPPKLTQYVGWGVAAALMVALVVTWIVTQSGTPIAQQAPPRDGLGQPVSGAPDHTAFAVTPIGSQLRGSRWLSALRRPDPPQAVITAAGQTVKTGPRERRRLSLSDGSVVYLNENTTLRTLADRRVAVDAGEIYLDVAPRAVAPSRQASGGPTTAALRCPPPVVSAEPGDLRPPLAAVADGTFIVETPARRLTALGTKFAVTVADKRTDVSVVQGRVQADQVAEPLAAGQRTRLADTADAPEVEPAPRLAELLYWTRDLMAAAEPVLVPESGYAGGAVTVKSGDGAEEPLSLRRYHVDVHIEDGFARTTIDQTYFNHLTRREEGTFHFPLPPDASISRLAMYVGGKLMEGGMVERDHGRNVYESIRYRMQDPALLEWIDGSTFKMRVFPLEPREEKRIILSYSQPVETLGGQARYRFPIGHSLNEVGQFSVHIRVRGGADGWNCATHALVAKQDGGDLVLDLPGETPGATAGSPSSAVRDPANSPQATKKGGAEPPATRLDGDLELMLTTKNTSAPPRFSTFTHEGHRYLMLRTAPELTAGPRPQRRDWIFVVEASADRSPLLARAQIEIVRGILSAADHGDTVSIISAGTRATLLTDEQPGQKRRGVLNSPANVASICDRLGEVHLIGALDLEAAFVAAGDLAKSVTAPVIVHIGSGVPALGERSDTKLAAKIPSTAQYVGVAVGRSLNRNLMKIAAAGHRGYFTQINPNEPLAWRATDLVTTLNTPRLLSLKAVATPREGSWLLTTDALTRGETLCALTRIPTHQPLPKSVTLSGQIDGMDWTREIPVDAVADDAGYLPRQWARLEIDRLLAADGAKHREEIVKLSKAMYVMSPYTSLLVLENEEMYEQYKVDRGRKDHWAMYPAPATIPVVKEEVFTQRYRDLVAAQGAARSHFDESRQAFTAEKAELQRSIESKNAVVKEALEKSKTTAELYETIVVRSPYSAYAPPRQLSRSERIELQQKLAVLVDDFNTLREERRFAESEATARQAADLAPDEAVTKQMLREVRFWRNVTNNPGLTDNDFVRVLQNVEEAGVSMNADQPFEFGNVRDWEAMANRRRRSSGFQPQVTILPPDATVSSNTAVSSDRRYVRITAIPFFSQVGNSTIGGEADLALLTYFGAAFARDNNVNGVIDDSQYQVFTESIDLREWLGPPIFRGTRQQLNRNSPHYNGDSDDVLAFTTRGNPADWITFRGRAANMTIYDPAIQASDLQDGRGVEAALSAFDASLISAHTWDPGVPSDGELYSRGHLELEKRSRRGYTEYLEYYLRDDAPISLETELALQETQTGWLMTGVGINSDAGLVGNLVINEWDVDHDGDGHFDSIWVSRSPGKINLNTIDDLQMYAAVQRAATSANADKLEVLVNAVTSAYLERVVAEDKTEINRRRQWLFDTANRVGTGDAKTAQAKQGLLEEFTRKINDLGTSAAELDQVAPPQGATHIELYTPPLERMSSVILLDTDAIRNLSASFSRNFEATPGTGGFLGNQMRNGSATSSYTLTDLLAYAPGMATNRLDIQAVLEEEGNEPLPKSGMVDPKAAELIAKARAAAWRSVEFGRGNGKDSPVASAIPLTIRFDGTGRFLFEQTTADGLKETVVCDGVNLWHVYPELGVAAQRKFSRVYRGVLCRMLPWLMPPVEDLAVGADVTAIDERTVAISYAGVAQLKTKAGKPVRHLQLRLVFGAGGQVEQQQLVDMPSGKVILSVRFGADGAIAVHDGREKEIGRRVYKLALAGAPDLTAPLGPGGVGGTREGSRESTGRASGTRKEGARAGLNGLVVVPLPLRTQNEITAKANVKADSDPATWDEPTAIATAAVVDGATARKIIHQRFFARGDFRLGFYTLLMRHNGAINFAGEPGGKDEKTVRHPLEVHPQSPLARYIADRISGDETTRPSGAHPELGDGLLAELDQYGALVEPLSRFAKLNTTEQKAQLDILRRTSTEFVGKARSPKLALHVGLLAERNLKHRDVHLALAGFWDRMGKQQGAGLVARYEKGRQLYRAGEFVPARNEFLAYHRAALDAGVLPPIDQEFYKAILRDENGWNSNDRWQKLITETGETLRKRHGATALLTLAWQCRALGDASQADALVAKAIEVKEDSLQPQQATQLVAAEYYHRTNQLDKADALVMKVLTARRETGWPGLEPSLRRGEVPVHQVNRNAKGTVPFLLHKNWDSPRVEIRLWQWAARLADQRGRFAEAARREHEALELVYGTPPEKIDLNHLRAAFSGLMARYQKLVAATALPGQEPPRELVAAIVAAADQWRSLDDRPDAACQAADKLLRTLGARDAAWQYLTTPLAGKAHESGPWMAMAGQLAGEGEFDLAEQSYRAAWQCEPTNPEILLGHATLLRDNGRPDAAKSLYQQIATGTWQQPRFNSVQQQAQRELETLQAK